jgi:hypothetical protein
MQVPALDELTMMPLHIVLLCRFVVPERHLVVVVQTAHTRIPYAGIPNNVATTARNRPFNTSEKPLFL